MKTFITSTLTAIGSLLLTATAYAQTGARDSALGGLKTSGDAAGLATTATLPQRVGQLLNGALSVIGIIFLILTVYGGFRILLSRGEADKIKVGRETILYGVLGMIIIVISYSLTTFVFDVFVTSR